ncbi:carboxylate-amine ligase [Arthrobacter silviterrae]|uniref:Putative glutamate--cysteine ligase 2 n=1 Tax=Arthrobacter silviterrae TaxID=2026658 RepID=A0ABX0DKL0_9MICC|nr:MULTISPECIES: glutamate--cysteine ligase [Arthrobacter]MCU6482495.1 glutamate--cysteine ligase [Arthrobacter sp. A2-55]MDQ0277556.1 carboxylate-amine ligase [Arthrobacter silviterrae]NGN85220.1 glutamate--cysteine ligase [Arthrobacter silviterrae]
MKIEFAKSEQSTLGLEWEIALVDAETGELAARASDVFANISEAHPDIMDDGEHPHIKGEMLQNTVELVTGVCHTVAEGTEDLRRNLNVLREAAAPLGLELLCAGTHPFSNPRSQQVTDKERYAKLVDRTQWWGSQMLIYGVHVHVGLDHVSKAMPVLDGLVNYFPHFQALSASSPFWNGEDTGYASQRALMFQQLPTAGLPFQFPDWASYESYVEDMFTTGVIDATNEIRWDIRPVAGLGTIEMRICDGMSTLEEIGSIAALTQCLVDDFSTTLDNGGTIPTMPPWHVQENKWRAARYGLEAIIILDAAGKEQLVTEHTVELLNKLEPVAAKLGCATELAGVEDIIARGASYQRQRRVAAAHGGELRAVVRELVTEMARN